MARAGPKKLLRYSDEFKLTVVKLSHMDGVEVGDVARTFDIHPWMLSKWRTQVKKGLIKGNAKGIPQPAIKRGEPRQAMRHK